MISVILVGKNESWRLKKSLQSALNLKTSYAHLAFDIIYVDSNSTDDSIAIAKSFKNVRIFQISGTANSAIARNIGAIEAKGKILVFLDADMEIQPEFVKHTLNKNADLIYPYLTGHLDDYFYTKEDFFLGHESRTYSKTIPSEEQLLNQNGGFCFIKKKTWNSVGGMRAKYRRSQDLDLTIRLKKSGIKIVRLPYLAAKHHTIDYRNEDRMWLILREGNLLYPGLLFRDHLFNKDVLKRSIRSEYTAVLLFLLCLSCLFTSFVVVFILIYLTALLFRIIIQSRNVKISQNRVFYIVERTIFQLCSDFCFWFGFFLFFPKNFNHSYNSIK